MEENTQTNAGQGFGIAALILGIIALVTAVIPCIGVIALIPGILGITFAVIALVQANQNNGAKAMIIIALVLASLGSAISAVWVLAFSTPAVMTNTMMKTFKNVINMNDLTKKLDNLGKEMEKNIEKGEGTYTITIKKTYSSTQDSLEKKLEELEGGDSLINVEKDTLVHK
ncbi:MAG TPA: DUF4190 domain-containing protein [Bacteroidetes bacterium]|nr:DUF4190 domain-containing protein [Bacteroidota bacterium]